MQLPLDMKADLHLHTTCSDGTLGCRELCALAKREGLSALSITDHDTIGAYDEAFMYAKEEGLILIPGVEFSTQCLGQSIHVLAYGFNPESEAIRKLCEKHAQRRTERNNRILIRLKRQGLPITEADLGVHPHSIGRPHIAQAMVHKGYVQSVQEAFAHYLAEGRPCFDLGIPFSVEETIEAIHRGGGKAVLAHPHLIENKQALDHLLTLSFDGIEVFYGRYPLDQVQIWAKIAAERDWMMTGGSDFHGPLRSNSSIGCSWAPVETMQELLHHFGQQMQLPV